MIVYRCIGSIILLQLQVCDEQLYFKIMINNSRRELSMRSQKRQGLQSLKYNPENAKNQASGELFFEENEKKTDELQSFQTIPRRNILTAKAKKDTQYSEEIVGANVIHKKHPVNRLIQTAKEGFRKNAERPQSKQQPRNKSGILKKGSIFNHNRPLTSKGQRFRPDKNNESSQLQINIKDDEFLGGHAIKQDLTKSDIFLISTSASTKKGIGSKIMYKKTSIDRQFLSLFAE